MKKTRKILAFMITFTLFLCTILLINVSAADSGDYLDRYGESQQCTHYTELISDMTTLNAGWYVLNGMVIIVERININSDVHLILGDGYTLDAQKGVNVSKNNSLKICAQSTSEGIGI